MRVLECSWLLLSTSITHIHGKAPLHLANQQSGRSNLETNIQSNWFDPSIKLRVSAMKGWGNDWAETLAGSIVQTIYVIPIW